MKTQFLKFVIVILLFGLVSGCARPRGFGPPGENSGGGPSFEMMAGPGAGPPVFLFSPEAALLTNASGYEAQLELEPVSGTNHTQKLTGQLKVSGTKLSVSLGPSKRGRRKKMPPGMDVCCVWDVAHNEGFALNEPLQGYALLTAPVGVAPEPVEMKTMARGEEQINGQACKKLSLTRKAHDGTSATITIWQPHAWAGMPTRIEFHDAAADFVVNLTHVQFKVQPRELFAIPDGFTRYESTAQMADELFLRQNAMRSGTMRDRRPPGEFPQGGPPPGGPPSR
jgi:hypothetical protein